MISHPINHEMYTCSLVYSWKHIWSSGCLTSVSHQTSCIYCAESHHETNGCCWCCFVRIRKQWQANQNAVRLIPPPCCDHIKPHHPVKWFNSTLVSSGRRRRRWSYFIYSWFSERGVSTRWTDSVTSDKRWYLTFLILSVINHWTEFSDFRMHRRSDLWDKACWTKCVSDLSS